MDEMTDFRQEEQEAQQAQIIGDHGVGLSHPFEASESRRFAALEQAIKVFSHTSDETAIVKAARAFESYLKGD